MRILKTISSLWAKDTSEAPSLVPQEAPASFVLMVDGITIGHLSHQGDTWVFLYSQEFKSRSQEYHAIVGFPHLDRVYESKNLWPFFLIRIPGLKQPAVQEVLKKESINANSEVDLLKRFGRKSIANPYELLYSPG